LKQKSGIEPDIDGMPFQGENKRTQIRQTVQMEVFPKGRNFR